MKNGRKITIFFLALLICLNLSACSKEYISTNKADYSVFVNEVVDAELYMPKLEELGRFDSIKITRKTRDDDFINTTETVALIVQYSQDNFETAVINLNREYDFIKTEIENFQDYEANVKNYSFKVDSSSLHKTIKYPQNEEVFYPSCSLIIGVNNLENKIAYLYYWDAEIHEMDDLDKFIEEKFVLS